MLRGKMRLSDLILLGDSLRSRRYWSYLSLDGGSTCGCALGGAALYLGADPGKNWNDKGAGDDILYTHFPWLDIHIEAVISQRFAEVCHGEISIEELADYVRSIEPDCDCNRAEVVLPEMATA
jgi:hypothetical protein